MTSTERQAAKAEVEAARAALVTHLNELEDAVNVPKRLARSVGRCVRDTKRWAIERPATAAAISVAGAVVVAGIVTLEVRAGRR